MLIYLLFTFFKHFDKEWIPFKNVINYLVLLRIYQTYYQTCISDRKYISPLNMHEHLPKHQIFVKQTCQNGQLNLYLEF